MPDDPPESFKEDVEDPAEKVFAQGLAEAVLHSLQGQLVADGDGVEHLVEPLKLVLQPGGNNIKLFLFVTDATGSFSSYLMNWPNKPKLGLYSVAAH